MPSFRAPLAFAFPFLAVALPAAEVAPAPASPPAAKAPAAVPPPGGGRGQTTAATPEELLGLTSFPPEFKATIFATPDQANYPVSVAAAPDGTLYVASDQNGSLDVALGRGRIIRLRDTDGDGRADEVKQFAKVDAPRGLVWDGDRLYVMHPPHVSVFIDHDGDGVADEEKVIVRDIGWTFRDRPADHASNGVSLGIDGWLYLAIGDFGFMNAEGTDGRRLQLRGGGVVRVRPDGTGMELFARGTRNILEVALSPELDGIARDNTNDGDGWDIKLHHFTGLEDHGYPRLFKNFTAEAVAWLADYGGGSGTGSVWLDEPGIPPQWRGPVTVDWGRERAYHHTLTPKGATFSATQEEFAKLPRATDLDVDAQSRIYIGSWRGGQYTYGGPNVGYIARLVPKDYLPTAVPDFARATDAALVELFNSPSFRTRLAAQRELLRRGTKSQTAALEKLAADASRALDTRILAIFTLKQSLGAGSHATLGRLAADKSVAAWAIRAITDRDDQLAGAPAAPLLAGLKSDDARTRKEAVVAIARLGQPENAAALSTLLGDSDPVVAHTAVQALVRLQDSAVSLAVIDDTNAPAGRRTGALRVLQAQHEMPIVDALIARLGRETDPARRDGLIRTLCRLYYVEGKWTGDSWGTRPDARGPYFQPERWAASEKINGVLKDLLDRAQGEDAAKLNEIFTLYRVSPGDTTARLMTLAETDDTLLATLATQLAAADTVPPAAIPLLKRAIAYVPPAPPPPPAGAPQPGRGRGGPRVPDTGPTQIRAMQALVKAGTPEAMEVVLATLPTLQNRGRMGDGVRDKSANALLQSTALENNYQLFAREAAKADSDSALWADAALLNLAARKFGATEARNFAAEQLEAGWKIPARRVQIIKAAAASREASRAPAFVQALDDPDPAVAEAAKAAVATLKIDVDAVRADANQTAPRVGTLKPEDVMSQVTATHGTVSRGEQLFTQAGCVACHTVNAADPLKGPFLGTAAKMFDRRALAEAVLDPNKSLAQGFVTNQFTLKDGKVVMGFVTREGADAVAIRDITGQQSEIKVANIAKREHLTMSLMPQGLMAGYTVRDFASLLDYLQSLADSGK